VSITPAVTTPAPSSTTAEIKPTLERVVGEAVAAAASAIMEALQEYRNGALTNSTKMSGGEAIAWLYKLRQFMVPYWDFDSIARKHGIATLRACDVNPAIAAELVSEVLGILAKVARANLN